MRTRLLLAIGALLPAAAAAQETPAPALRYEPDSAEYLLTNHAESPAPQAPSLTQEIRARLVSSSIGSDSLKVIVTILDQKVGGVMSGFPMELPAPLELRIPRSGYVMPFPDAAQPRTMGPSTYPRLFASMILPDASHSWGDLKRQEDSLARAGVKATAYTALPSDTVVGGNHLVRRSQDITFTSAGMRSQSDSMVRIPPFRGDIHTERWVDSTGRLFHASLRSHTTPVEKGTGFPEVTAVIRLERLSP